MDVLFGSFSSAPFAEGLRRLLSDTGEFTVVSFDDAGTIAAGTDVDAPSVLLMEGRDPAACRRYLGVGAIRLVVLVDPLAARAFIGVDNPRWRELADVVRALAHEAQIGRDLTEGDRVRVISAGQFPLPRGQTGGVGSDALAPLIGWLETSLALHLLRRAGEEASGVLGWSVAPREAVEMLGFDPAGLREEELAARLDTIDRDLFESRATLPQVLTDLAVAFSLTELELRLLCFTLAPELDGRYATALGVLQDDLSRRRPSLTVLASLLSGSRLSPWDLRRTLQGADSVLGKGLLRPADAEALAVDVGYLPSAAVVAHLVASSCERAAALVGAQLRSSLAESEPPLSSEESQLAWQLQLATGHGEVVGVVGGDRSRRWFSRLTTWMGLPLLVGDLGPLETGVARTSAVSDWVVLSHLWGSALLVLGTDALEEPERADVVALLTRRAAGGELVAFDGHLTGGAWTSEHLTLRAPGILAAQRSQWWARAAQQAQLPLGPGGPERLAATVTVEPADVPSVVAMAARLAVAGAAGSAVQLVQRAARDLVPTTLPAGVQKVEPVYGWDDIVLGEESRKLLQAIPEHVLQAGRVLEDWGFAARVPHGRGVAALFSGPSGTGKTMAAQIIARELGVDLFHVDLSKTVSKYIGETEKNLDRVFQAAEGAGAVLLFDEADAVFGKRTEIKDAHDRHANVEVAYLLQRLESFRGLTILTTNLKQNIDSAFVRRLRFIVDFALPNATERASIWRKAFPDGAPLSADVDVATFAGRLQITGGSIQNIALHAAFLAATHGGPIGFEHLLAAARRELVKTGMRTAEQGLNDLVPAPVRVGGARPVPA